MTKDELIKMMGDVAKSAMDENAKRLGLDKVDRKFGFGAFFNGASEEKIASMDSKQKTAEFFKAVYHKDFSTLANLKAMVGGTGSAGGFIVPEEFAAEVNRIVEDFGIVAKLATKYPMSSDTLRIPRLSASVSVTYPGEVTAGTASQPTLEEVALLAKTIVGITPMSNELLADANVNVVDLLATLFAEAIAGTIDSQAFTGTGSPFTGIFTDAGVTVVTPATGNSTFTLCATPDNFRTLISQVKPWALSGSAFFMNRAVWELVQTKKASSGGEYFASAVNPVVSGSGVAGMNAPAGTLWGYPVYLTDKITGTTGVSTKFAVFGNLKHIYLGERDGLSVEISREATVGSDSLFEKNMSAVRVTSRHAIAVGLPSAFAVLKTSAS